MTKRRVAILGSGNIGTDLLVKTLRSETLCCSLFVGRNMASAGLAKACSLGVPVSDQGIQAIMRDPDCCDIVFDATSAADHHRHWPILRDLGKRVIDLTPARVGAMCVPAVNIEAVLSERNVNLVTCGGQASIPIAAAIASTQADLEYIEVVSSVSSRSAGPATRINIDEYIETTETAVRHFTSCNVAKSILILNPAQPCIDMQTTVFARVPHPNREDLLTAIEQAVRRLQCYVPGYRIAVPPVVENGRIMVSIRVTGLGDHLPRYAGNLDIITCAALTIAERFALLRD
jgi:acetaldehyde dehydrogenase (acetylating)